MSMKGAEQAAGAPELHGTVAEEDIPKLRLHQTVHATVAGPPARPAAHNPNSGTNGIPSHSQRELGVGRREEPAGRHNAELDAAMNQLVDNFATNFGTGPSPGTTGQTRAEGSSRQAAQAADRARTFFPSVRALENRRAGVVKKVPSKTAGLELL